MDAGTLTTADKINLFNALGAWAAAIGTISAVVVALYLARRDRIISVRLSAGHRVVGQGTDISKFPDYCVIRAVNVGVRNVTITGIGWKVGFLKKQFLDQILSFPTSPSPMPVTLADGEEATWHIPFKFGGEHPDWIDDFPKVLGKNPHLAAKTLRVFAYTSVGKPVVAKVERGLLDRLVKAAEARVEKTKRQVKATEW